MEEKDKNRDKEFKSKLYDEFIFGLKESKNRNKKIRLLRLYSSFILSLVIMLVSATFLISIIENNEVPDSYFSKSIKSDIKEVIENNGDISTIKHIYKTREIKKRKLPDLFINKQADYYPASTSLNEILNDLKVEYFTTDNGSSSYLNKLNEIILLHNQINPFDKLQTNQKFAFENIRDKLDTNYVEIQDELNRIADELNSKNILVDRHLEKSNLSYWVSIIALVLTIILSTIQIYQNRNQRIGNLLRGILSKEKDKEGNGENQSKEN